MRKVVYLVLGLVLVFSAVKVFSEEDESQDYTLTKDGLRIPAGMEVKKVGNANILVPKGGKIRKVGDQLVMEDSSEYAARKFQEIEKRLQNIEERLQEIEKGVTPIFHGEK